MTTFHENWQSREQVKRSSDRTFGIVMAVFFALVALLPLLRGHHLRGWAAGLSGIFILSGLLAPKILAPLNRIWTALGVILHRVMNPLVLGVFFFGVFTPLAWILRLMGKDFLRLRSAPDTASYWIPRQPPGPEPESMANQF